METELIHTILSGLSVIVIMLIILGSAYIDSERQEEVIKQCVISGMQWIDNNCVKVDK